MSVFIRRRPVLVTFYTAEAVFRRSVYDAEMSKLLYRRFASFRIPKTAIYVRIYTGNPGFCRKLYTRSRFRSDFMQPRRLDFLRLGLSSLSYHLRNHILRTAGSGRKRRFSKTRTVQISRGRADFNRGLPVRLRRWWKICSADRFAHPASQKSRTYDGAATSKIGEHACRKLRPDGTVGVLFFLR